MSSGKKLTEFCIMFSIDRRPLLVPETLGFFN